MLPLYDENPTYERPYVTYALIAVNTIVFLYMFLIEYVFGPYELAKFYYDWSIIPYFVSNGERLYTIFTSMFMHGGFLHFGGNMLYLYIFGNNIEDSMGHKKFIIFYLACGVAAGFAQILTEPGSLIPMIGASGAIAGVLGAYLLLFPKANVVTLIIYFIVKVPAVIILGFWFLMQLFSGIGSLTASGEGGVAYFAHIGGFACGFLLIKLFRRKDYKSRKCIKDDWERINYHH